MAMKREFTPSTGRKSSLVLECEEKSGHRKYHPLVKE